MRIGRRELAGPPEREPTTKVSFEARKGQSDRNRQADSPTPLVSEAISHGPHVVADRGPFGPADDAYVLD